MVAGGIQFVSRRTPSSVAGGIQVAEASPHRVMPRRSSKARNFNVVGGTHGPRDSKVIGAAFACREESKFLIPTGLQRSPETYRAQFREESYKPRRSMFQVLPQLAIETRAYPVRSYPSGWACDDAAWSRDDTATDSIERSKICLKTTRFNDSVFV